MMLLKIVIVSIAVITLFEGMIWGINHLILVLGGPAIL